MDGYAVSRPQGATQHCELPLDGVRESVSCLNEFIRALRKQCFFVLTGKPLMMPEMRFKLLLLLLLALAAQSANAGQANYITGQWQYPNYVESWSPREPTFLVKKNHDKRCQAGIYRVAGSCSATANTPISDKNDCHGPCPDYQNQTLPIHTGKGYQNEVENDYSFSGFALRFDRRFAVSTHRIPSPRSDNSRIQSANNFLQIAAQLAPTKLPKMPSPKTSESGQPYVNGNSFVQYMAPAASSITQSTSSAINSSGTVVSSENNVYGEYEKSVQNGKTITTLGPNLFGDQVDLSHGALYFSATDVSLPGNSDLPVALTRTNVIRNVKGYAVYDFSMADWQLDIPNISFESAFEWQDQRCSVSSATSVVPPSIQTQITDTNPNSITYGMITTNIIRPSHYWHGFQAQMPGGGELLLVNNNAAKPAQGGPYYWSTNNQTFFSCSSRIKNGTGEGFVAITSDGTKYWFDWRAQTFEPNLELGLGYYLRRARMTLYATRVEDRHGNWVNYTYTNNAYSPVKLSQISSSDGRSLTVSYISSGYRDYISAVSDGTRTWRYEYEYFSTPFPLLKKVVLPDSSAWEFSFAGLSDAKVEYWYNTDTRVESHTCESPGDTVIRTYTGTIKHPSGAAGEFTVTPTRFGRSNVSKSCQTNTFFFPKMPSWFNAKNFQQNIDAVNYDVLAIKRKRVSGVGIQTTTLDYSYTSSQVGFSPSYPICQSDSCAGKNVTLVSNSNGTWEKFTFGNSYAYDEGKLLRSEKGRGAIIQSTETNSYELAKQGLPFPAPFAASPQRGLISTFSSEYIRPLKTTTIIQDGVSFNSVVDGFDGFARPTSITRFSALAPSKTDMVVYRDDLNKWVIGQINSVSTGMTGDAATTKEVSRTEYDASSNLPMQTYSFGALQSTVSYNPNGTVATIKDANNYVTSLSNYKRGMPQQVDYPDSSSETAEINDFGWLTSSTDARGNTTRYEYNPIGRLTKIIPPANDTIAWNPTTLSFEKLATPVYDLLAGAWKQTITIGNSRSETYFDAMWRPVITREYDNANIAGTQRFTRLSYDDEGRTVFASYPGKGDQITQGNRTVYDDLGRVTQIKQDSELGVLTATREYLPGFKIKTTNAKQLSTITSFMAWDKPDTNFPMRIESPEDVLTTFTRDMFGKTLSVTRDSLNNGGGGVSRSYAYDAYQRLCQRVEPESGTTLFNYDAVGNLLWSAAGPSIVNTSVCTKILPLDRVARTYDPLNRVISVDVPNSVDDLSYSYFPGGLIQRVSNDDVVWNYTYNALNLPATEILTLDNRTKTISHHYNADGVEDQLTLPSNLGIAYAPNALGQATQAGTFATSVSYRSNGAMAGFTYGNSVVHRQLPNLRGLPAERSDSLGTSFLQDERVAYDENGNVRCIRDSTAGNVGDRDMQHDGLDRLVNTSAPRQWWANASTSYDVLDNIRGYTMGNRVHTYVYDANNRLNRITAPFGATTSPQSVPQNATSMTRTALAACDNFALLEDIGTLSVEGGGTTTPPGGGGTPPGGGGNNPPGSGQQSFPTPTSPSSSTRAIAPVSSFSSSSTGGATTAVAAPCCQTPEQPVTVYQFGYDANGNTISGRQSMVYDALNRVTQVTGKESYLYDGHGRRVKTTRVSDGQINYSIYSLNGQLVAEDDFRINKKTDYVYLNGRLVAQRSAALTGTTAQTTTYINTYLHTDSLGSPVAYTNQAAEITKIERYAPYGEPSDQMYDQGPGFTGHVTDAATGLTYAQQRYYDPVIGRFLSVDPVETDPNMGAYFNRFAYANNNPYRFTDPDGREIYETTATYLRNLFGKGSEGTGHHWVPFGSTNGPDMDISNEARAVFGQSTSGEKLPNSEHNTAHLKYNTAVREELISWSKGNRIDMSKMTAKQAGDFVSHIKGGTKNPVISQFVSKIHAWNQKVITYSKGSPAPFLSKWFLRVAEGSTLVDQAEKNISLKSTDCQAKAWCRDLDTGDY
jgi:RHS repeat-associated protein